VKNTVVEKAGRENAGPNFTGVEKAGPPSIWNAKWISINVSCTDKKTLQSSEETVD